MKKWNQSGFTFVELIVTVGIAGVLFLSVTTLLFHIHKSWLRGRDTIELRSDIRFCRMMIEKELRKATGMEIDSEEITIWAIDGTTVTFSLNGTDIEYKVTGTGIDVDGVILRDVIDLKFSYVGSNAAKVSITQEKVTNQASGAVLISESEFVVRSRNK